MRHLKLTHQQISLIDQALNIASQSSEKLYIDCCSLANMNPTTAKENRAKAMYLSEQSSQFNDLKNLINNSELDV